MTLRFYIAMKAGALRNGWGQGASVYHAVPVGGEGPLCTGRPAIDWKSEPGSGVTCPKCLRKLSKLTPITFAEGVPEIIGF